MLCVLAAVLLAHGLAFDVVPLHGPPAEAPGVRRPLQVRHIEALTAASPPPADVPAAPGAMPVQAGKASLAAPPLAVPVQLDAAPVLVSTAEAGAPGLAQPPDAEREPPADVPAPDAAAPVMAAADGAALVAVAADVDSMAVPTYATRLPPAATLRYKLQHGAVSGEGNLVWRPGPAGYELRMGGEAFGLHLLSWTSRGGIDRAGLAPVRFVDRRLRSERAANFQREKRRITFSGPTTEYPLVAGAQDRLSFMVQLSAVVAADPARFGPGAQLSMFVVGARGDADVWSFTVLPAETIDLPAGRVARAVHLRRDPRKPFDQQVDVWLDPARSHFPVRVRLASEGDGDGTEFLLRRYSAP